jgi:alkanesulfonate monooxygenase SsuD/methylene tetrahydromethanopterin reductase-like flavin-dependent oxidoreductase (luciferase family)
VAQDAALGQAASRPLPVGIFDWIDRSYPTLGDIYEQRLRMLEAADRAGFYCYHVAEHHGTPLGMAPSPGLFLAAAAERTRRLRLGPLVFILPLYDPLRLLQEVCMLDHLSRGRLELGVGRGTSPFEVALYGRDPAETRAMFREALDILTQGLATGRVNYEGRYYTYRDVEVMLRPVQQPYPPLWYPTSTPESVPWVAQHGLHTMFSHILRSLARTREFIDAYDRAYAERPDGTTALNAHAGPPFRGIFRQVYVAETDADALREAKPAYAAWFANYNYLWAKHGRLDRHGDEEDFAYALERRGVLVGSPATVRAQVQECLDVTGANYFAAGFAWGSFTTEQVLRSLDLFAREVMPALRCPTGPATDPR